jgi:hypothetical protein
MSVSIATCVAVAVCIAGCGDGISPGTASEIQRVSADNLLVVPGRASPESLTVRVLDHEGRVLPGATVHWTVAAGDGTVSPQTSTTNFQGLARASFTLGTDLQTAPRVVATVPGLPGVDFTLMPSFPHASGLVLRQLSGDGQTGSPGQVLDPFAVALELESGAPVVGAPIEWDVTDGAAELRETTPTDAQGTSAFTLTIRRGGVSTAVVTIGDLQTEFNATALVAFSDVMTRRDQTCALGSDSHGYCWGLHSSLPAFTFDIHPGPYAVRSDLSFSAIVPGGCGLTSDGSAYCWGSINGAGLPPRSIPNEPVAVSGGLKFTQLVLGLEHACGLTAAGAVYCWGGNGSGQIDPTGSFHSTPAPVDAPTPFTQITTSGSGRHTCGLAASGAAYCWGANESGQLGTTATSPGVPTPVEGGLIFERLSAGADHTCGIIESGAAYCWGNNHSAQLGNGDCCDDPQHPSIHPLPEAVVGGLSFIALTGGTHYTCGLVAGGAAHCWGLNLDGQLGNGSDFPSSAPSPTPVAGGLSFTQISAGAGMTCGTATDERAYCWGSNSGGQLGDGTTTDQTSPVRVRFQP